MVTNGFSGAPHRLSALPCLFASASVAAFFAPVDEAAFAHEGEGSAVVRVGEKGFEPRSVTVDPGDTVVFENVDDEAHWPASDDHPTHEEYPEFDPRKPVQPNTEWSFTFERPGQWKYHDHMNPYLSSSSCANGVFMENFSVDQKLHLSKFLKESDPFYPCMEQAERHKPDCYLYAPTYYLSLHPEDYAGALKWRNDAEAGFESACASGVGMQALKENLDGPKLIESVCMGGQSEQTAPCIVGMTSLYISHHGSLEPARELCARLEAPNRRPSYVSVVTHRSLFRS